MVTKMEDEMTETRIEIFGAAVTDNAPVIVKTLLISEGKYSHIAVCTGAPHTPHLITGDIIKLKSVDDTLGMCKSIVKKIKDSQLLTDHFTAQSSRKKCGQICCLTTPVPTKWG
jgi:hypothetical protein